MYCLEAFVKNIYIKCNDYKEYERVCIYLASKGVTWVSGFDINKSTLFVTDKYPIWLTKGKQVYNGTEGLCWTDSVVNVGDKYYPSRVRTNDKITVLDCNELKFE